jgi:hypothetical protein
MDFKFEYLEICVIISSLQDTSFKEGYSITYAIELTNKIKNQIKLNETIENEFNKGENKNE